MIRPLLLLVLVGTAAFGQGGTWTGYVRGWVPDQQPLFVYSGLPRFRGHAPAYVQPYPQAWAAQVYAAQMNYAAQVYATDRYLAERREERRAAEQLAAEQYAAQRYADERDAAEEAASRRYAAEQAEAMQRLAAERAARTAEPAPAPTVAAAPPPDPQPAPPPQPRVKGPDVFKWTDEDGVTHYSTRVPAGAREKAKKVNAELSGVSFVVEKR